MLQKVNEAFAELNGESKEGRIQKGVPDERWNESLTRNPLKPLPADKAHLLLPNCTELQIRGGMVQPTVDGERFFFSNPEAFARLGSGYRIIVRYDAGAPAIGAAILSADDSIRNHFGYRPGDYICHADLIDSSPAFSASKFFRDENVEKKRRYKRALSAMFGAPGLFGTAGRSSAELRDGAGKVNRLERGGTAVPLTPMQPDETADRGNRLKREAKRREEDMYDEEAERKSLAKTLAAEAAAIERGDITVDYHHDHSHRKNW